VKICISMIFMLVISTPILPAQADWEWQYSTTTEDLNDVYFVDNNTGWAIGNNGTILNTVDGGDNWLQQNSGTKNKLRAVHFINKNLGWVVGNESMLYTEDGGLNWSKFFQGYIKDIYCLYFIDEDNGWVCGSDSIILKTTSGGGNWEVIPSMVGKFDKIFFFNNRMGFLHSKDDAGYIYMTEDGGHTLINKSRSRKSFKSFFFLEPNLGWACGGLIGETNKVSGWLDISTDVAGSWVSHFEEGLMHSIFFFDSLHGIALSQRNRGIVFRKTYDVFLKTVDGGKTWDSSEPGGNAFHFIDQNTGWIVGYLGKIYKTTTGGGLINNSAEETIKVNEFGLSQNYPNPFNPKTTINYELPISGFVELSIYNLIGEKIATLISEKQSPGYHQVEWNAVDFAGGVYFYQIKAGEFHDIKKMILIR